MMEFFRSKRADVLSHWYSLVPNFGTSAKEFYETIERALQERKVPGLEISRVEFSEGGILSDKREYLRMSRERLVFDVCGAPFGTSYFFSCRFAEIPAVIQLWQLLLLLRKSSRNLLAYPMTFHFCVGSCSHSFRKRNTKNVRTRWRIHG